MPTPCESWPLRLASTRLSATVAASVALLPAAPRMAAHWPRRSAAEKVLLIRKVSLSLGVRSHHGAELPGHELVLPVAVALALALFARGGRQHQPEDALA